MHGMFRTALKINRKYTTIKCWLETMNISHKKISGDISLAFFECTLNCPRNPHYNSLEVLSKTYLPAERTTETQVSYEGKVMFKHVQIRLVASNEPLMGCRPLTDWLRKGRCIYSTDTFDDNFCAWRFLAIYKRKDIQKDTEFVTRVALNLAREYYGDTKLKRNNLRPTKLVDFDGIARHHNLNVMLYEPKKDRGKDAGSIWRLVYGKVQYKNGFLTINMGLLGGHCFYIKKMNVLCKRWECKRCRQIFTWNKHLIRHLKEEICTEGKTKIICSRGKFKHILNSSKKVLYGGDTKFSYTACQWIEAQAMKTGKHIHHKMCGHGRERMVNAWILNGKSKKHQ